MANKQKIPGIPAQDSEASLGAVEAYSQLIGLSRERFVPISSVPGLLWNCTGIMPRRLCEQIDGLLPPGHLCEQGSTYAQGARCIKPVMQKQ